MFNINFWNILFTVINVLVIYAIFCKFLLKPVKNIIQSREDMIRQQFDSAEQTQKEADQIKADLEENLSHAHEEANAILLEAKAQAATERQKSIDATKVETDRMIERANAEIADAKQKAEKETKDQVAVLAMMAAKKILEMGEVNDTSSK
jgi:F-type H+-transporting ATPase subunit b